MIRLLWRSRFDWFSLFFPTESACSGVSLSIWADAARGHRVLEPGLLRPDPPDSRVDDGDGGPWFVWMDVNGSITAIDAAPFGDEAQDQVPP